MTGKIKGVPVSLGGVEYIMPPLCLADVERLLPKIQTDIEGKRGIDGAMLATVVDVVGSALRRNYPEITDVQIKDGLDMGNFRSTVQATLGASGLEPRAPGETTGEAAPATASPGNSSTQS